MSALERWARIARAVDALGLVADELAQLSETSGTVDAMARVTAAAWATLGRERDRLELEVLEARARGEVAA